MDQPARNPCGPTISHSGSPRSGAIGFARTGSLAPGRAGTVLFKEGSCAGSLGSLSVDAVIGSLYALHLLYTRFPASTAPLQRVDILPRYNAVCALALTQAAKHLMLNSSGISAFSQRRT